MKIWAEIQKIEDQECFVLLASKIKTYHIAYDVSFLKGSPAEIADTITAMLNVLMEKVYHD